ncbi:nicotianamine synthase family protein [Dichotomicrobium thermohalophilum]|uniref:Nicotianamine synthase-like protein n=1 Tax=Dichotomicrobium thermohalophilum TaxID=933063 RepID=A0A397PMC8_9HYPH|nr:nicotianamine synthase family protein [Dichotomicrobium thermohalophilum]RIA47274.1 nicotianamine synthase-like protein [Dichotomicrobium thermohalophilum]
MWTRERAIVYLNETLNTLRQQDDLSPDNPQVTETLRCLVATLRTWHRDAFGADLANDPALAEARTELPRLCGAAECQMEKWWCRKALASDAPERVLWEFWYLPNYLSLHNAETALAGPAPLRQTVFLGSGALPLTAILLAQADERARVRCVDMDWEACALAEALIGALGLQDRIAVQHARGEACDVPKDAAVICASLLDAPGLYAHLAASGVARLLVRDVEGVYCWLYRPADRPGPPFRQRARTAPSSTRINITRHFERRCSSQGLGAGWPGP